MVVVSKTGFTAIYTKQHKQDVDLKSHVVWSTSDERVIG